MSPVQHQTAGGNQDLARSPDRSAGSRGRAFFDRTVITRTLTSCPPAGTPPVRICALRQSRQPSQRQLAGSQLHLASATDEPRHTGDRANANPPSPGVVPSSQRRFYRLLVVVCRSRLRLDWRYSNRLARRCHQQVLQTVVSIHTPSPSSRYTVQ